jgi:type 1 glutamine amidotransferase
MRRPHLFRLFLPALVVAVTVTAPTATQPAVKKLLFLTHAGLFKHPSLGPAEQAVMAMGKAGGYEVTTLEGYKQEAEKLDLSMVTPGFLNQFDGLMLMTNGNLPFTTVQKRAIMDFVGGGKALIGAHCATLTHYDTPEFGEMFGAYYLRSIVPGSQISQGRITILKVENPTHPATRMLGPSWPLVEEYYRFGTSTWDASRPDENRSQVGNYPIPLAFSRDKVRVLLSIDTERTDLSNLTAVTKGGDYPQAWEKEYGKGRVFYTALGHREDIWGTDPVFRAHVNGGIRWALRLEQ